MNFLEYIDQLKDLCDTYDLDLSYPFSVEGQVYLKLTDSSNKEVFKGTIRELDAFKSGIKLASVWSSRLRLNLEEPRSLEPLIGEVLTSGTNRVEAVSWEEIRPIWADKLWPGRDDIETHSTMLYKKGYDHGIKERYPSIFLAVKNQEGEIVAVNSGHQTTDSTFRSRGLWVNPEYRGNGYSKQLLLETENYASRAGCTMIWSVPRKESLHAYTNAGYVQDGEFFFEAMKFGPNCFVYKELGENK